MKFFLILINLKRIHKQIIVLLLDILISFFACLSSILIIYDINIISFKTILLLLLYSIGFIPFFITFGLYRTIFRYSGRVHQGHSTSDAVLCGRGADLSLGFVRVFPRCPRIDPGEPRRPP